MMIPPIPRNQGRTSQVGCQRGLTTASSKTSREAAISTSMQLIRYHTNQVVAATQLSADGYLSRLYLGGIITSFRSEVGIEREQLVQHHEWLPAVDETEAAAGASDSGELPNRWNLL